MVMSNSERVGRALDLLRDGLRPACAAAWEGFYGPGWPAEVNQRLHHPGADPASGDVAFHLNGLKATWGEVFGHGFGPAVRSLIFEVAEARNRWAHQEPFSGDDTSRALDSMERLLEAFGAGDCQRSIRELRRGLMRQIFEEETRAERRRTAAKPTGGQPQAGLVPWREIITPHADVREGRLEQAEFAAYLHQVADGTADEEYRDPREFFARTYLTEGLRNLLLGAARRLSGAGGDPVVELQTNFGGGKTHSMIALYHLASGVPAGELPGVGELLAEAGVSLPPEVARAALVGHTISPSTPAETAEGLSLRTLWGRLAYQLGGAVGYEMVRVDDEAATNPGAGLRRLFERFGPAVVLIDEWVAYIRQMRDAGDPGAAGVGRTAGGDFDTQFTFAQALTEAAAAVPNVVVLVTVPASDIEVGGDRGRTALDRLRNVLTRVAAQWQPATPDESFEIVRRRLFDPVPAEQARVRDAAIGAFADMYRSRPGEFPSGAGEAAYRRRMEMSYPVHPELFDRLFDDWSTLDRFQRTRGVLRLMALAISQLWQRGDRSLLIMPSNLPMDWGPLVSEMKKYLEDNWDPVIRGDVDGPNSLPLRIDNDTPHFGSISATRRVARTVYMGSAPRPDAKRGVDLRSVVLGCTQPGESPGQFADALKRLSDEATHLYVDGNQYWYSLQPNVTRMSADRAASNYTDRDADDEVKRRLGRQRDRGIFAAVQIFAEGPGDVPDSDDGVRLVVLAPAATHSTGDENSPAAALAGRILAQRDGGPRLNRNMVVFTAAAANRLAELRAAARSYLAWCSIVEDSESLDLTAYQAGQARTKQADTSQQVDALIAETFTQVLIPTLQPGTPEVAWQTVRASTDGDIGARVSRKLASSEELIARLGGVRVRMDIDRFDLWSDRGDISVGELWQTYARFPYMARLSSFDVLAEAVSDGTANMNWPQETFAYAEGHDGEQWVGVQTAQHVAASPGGLLIYPDFAPAPAAPGDGEAGEAGEAGGGRGGDGRGDGGGGGRGGDGEAGEVETDSARPDEPQPGAPSATQFYAQFDLDPVRGIKQLGQILEHVSARLGPDLELSLELRANKPDGYDDATQRIVSENATNLGAKASEFE